MPWWRDDRPSSAVCGGRGAFAFRGAGGAAASDPPSRRRVDASTAAFLRAHRTGAPDAPRPGRWTRRRFHGNDGCRDQAAASGGGRAGVRRARALARRRHAQGRPLRRRGRPPAPRRRARGTRAPRGALRARGLDHGRARGGVLRRPRRGGARPGGGSARGRRRGAAARAAHRRPQRFQTALSRTARRDRRSDQAGGPCLDGRARRAQVHRREGDRRLPEACLRPGGRGNRGGGHRFPRPSASASPQRSSASRSPGRSSTPRPRRSTERACPPA